MKHTEHTKLKKGAYEMILEGRKPSAVVRLSPEHADDPICGAAELYTTPLGVVLCAEVTGLSREKRSEILGLCIGDEQTPIYASAGYAWCAVMTGHRSVSDLIGTTVTLERDRKSLLGHGTVCAPAAV